jgi:hypothetical protein
MSGIVMQLKWSQPLYRDFERLTVFTSPSSCVMIKHQSARRVSPLTLNKCPLLGDGLG